MRPQSGESRPLLRRSELMPALLVLFKQPTNRYTLSDITYQNTTIVRKQTITLDYVPVEAGLSSATRYWTRALLNEELDKLASLTRSTSYS